MFESMKDAAITMALGKIRDKVLDQYLEGIGTVETINYKNKKLFLGLAAANRGGMFGHLLCSRWKRGNGQLFFGQCALCPDCPGSFCGRKIL